MPVTGILRTGGEIRRLSRRPGSTAQVSSTWPTRLSRRSNTSIPKKMNRSPRRDQTMQGRCRRGHPTMSGKSGRNRDPWCCTRTWRRTFVGYCGDVPGRSHHGCHSDRADAVRDAPAHRQSHGRRSQGAADFSSSMRNPIWRFSSRMILSRTCSVAGSRAKSFKPR